MWLSRHEPRCLDCAYSLTGLESMRCPECGREFDPADSSSYRWQVLDGRQYLRKSAWAFAGVLLPAALFGLTRLVDLLLPGIERMVIYFGYVVVILVGLPFARDAWVSSFQLVSMGRRALLRERCSVQYWERAWAGFVVAWMIAFAPLVLLTASLAILLW